jgi:hypothetical protein
MAVLTTITSSTSPKAGQLCSAPLMMAAAMRMKITLLLS